MFDIKKMEEEQSKLAKKVVLKDDFNNIASIGGVDVIVVSRDLISSIAVCDYKTMDLKEESSQVSKTEMPYISGFRAYREGKAITEAFLKLKSKPDIVMFVGNGILHPRKIGLASHMGILLDVPAIGVAKTLICGSLEGNKILLDGRIVGETVITREHARPLFVSPGHRITLKTSVEMVKRCIKYPHKLPEPLHLAHRQADKVKDTMFGSHNLSKTTHKISE